MKKNSTTLFLESYGSITPLSLLEDGTPDFSNFSEPTLSVLVKAWQDFLESGAELEIVEDLNFETIAHERWTDFNLYLFSQQTFLNYGIACNAINPWLFSAVITAYNKVESLGIYLSDFDKYWPLFCQTAEVLSSHREEWAESATQFSLREEFVSLIRGC